VAYLERPELRRERPVEAVAPRREDPQRLEGGDGRRDVAGEAVLVDEEVDELPEGRDLSRDGPGEGVLEEIPERRGGESLSSW